MKKTKKMLELEERLGEDLGVYLRREYEEKSKTPERIGEEIGTATTNVRRWIGFYGIKIRSYSEARLPNGVTKPSIERVKQLYITEKKSPLAISKEIGVSRTTIN